MPVQLPILMFFLTLMLMGRGDPRKMMAILQFAWLACLLAAIRIQVKIQLAIYRFFLYKVFGGPAEGKEHEIPNFR